MNPYSVLMAFFRGDTPEFLDLAIRSLEEQTVLPEELVLVQDGPVDISLQSVVEAAMQRNLIPVKVIIIPQNRGLGYCLAEGVLNCSNELIGRMDADDICAPNRFELQLQKMQENPEIAVLGSCLYEFVDSPETISAVKKAPPRSHIFQYSRFRNPLNHPSVLFRRTRVLEAGNYRDFVGFEDYELWMRMLSQGAVLDNLQVPLLFYRKGSRFIERRHGKVYSRRERDVFRHFRRSGYLSTRDFTIGIVLRSITRQLPRSVLEGIYRLFLRK